MTFKQLLLAATITVTAGSANANPAYGTWQTAADKGQYAHITIVPCGDKICGKVTKTFNQYGEYQAETLGKNILRDMVEQADGSFDGSLWRPSNDKIYTGSMKADGDLLNLEGCVLGGLICAKQQWARVSK